jgi:hypothetical protein
MGQSGPVFLCGDHGARGARAAADGPGSSRITPDGTRDRAPRVVWYTEGDLHTISQPVYLSSVF